MKSEAFCKTTSSYFRSISDSEGKYLDFLAKHENPKHPKSASSDHMQTHLFSDTMYAGYVNNKMLLLDVCLYSHFDPRTTTKQTQANQEKAP